MTVAIIVDQMVLLSSFQRGPHESAESRLTCQDTEKYRRKKKTFGHHLRSWESRNTLLIFPSVLL